MMHRVDRLKKKKIRYLYVFIKFHSGHFQTTAAAFRSERSLGLSWFGFGQQRREREKNTKYSVFSWSIQTAPASPHRPH